MVGSGVSGARNAFEPSQGALAQQHVLVEILAPLVSEPRKLAAELLTQFGSIKAIAQADEDELSALTANDTSWVQSLSAARRLINAGNNEVVRRSRLDPMSPELHQYLSGFFRREDREVLVALYADKRANLLCDEVIAYGSEDALSLSFRALIRRSLALNARFVLLAHNHPSGCSQPSLQDILFTKKLVSLADQVGVSILDHLIFGQTVTSMRRWKSS